MLRIRRAGVTLAMFAGCVPLAQADAVTDWNLLANEWVAEAKLGTPPAIRVLAIVQTAVNDAVGKARPAASVEAAVAAANRAALVQLLPAQQAAIAAAYQAALAKVAPGAPRDAGIAIGERAASVCSPRVATTAPRPRRPTGRTPARASTCPPRCRRSRIGRNASPG